MMNTQLPAAARAGSGAEIFAWAMYDWANSAYSTLLITVVLHYIQVVVVPGGLGPAAFAWGISVSMLAAAVLSPIVGALADANCSKRKWLAGTALLGACAAVLMGCIPPGQTWLIMASFVATNVLFDLSLVPYNGFLQEITDERTINRVSAWGFALGYLGGSVPLLIAGWMVHYGRNWGLSDATDQCRAGILVMGLWWGVFTLPAVWILRDRRAGSQQRQPIHRAARLALREVGRTLANVRLYPVALLFLVAYLFYNDGIQTVITQANTLALKELRFSLTDLIFFVLIVQWVALPGTLLMALLSDRLGQKPTLMGCLAVWVGLLVAAMFVRTKAEFWALGVVLALVLGGSQSVSRAVMGLLAPPQHSAEFFGFFNLSGKAASFLGPAQFGLIIWLSGSARLASLSLLIFFLAGWILLARTNVREGWRQARQESGPLAAQAP